jgi:hypothetical protein
MTLFEKYSYKQKNFALLILSVLLFAAAYKRSFKTTIETRAYIEELEQKQALALQSQQEIKRLQIEINQINRILGKEHISIEQVQQGFLNFFAAKSSACIVNQMEEVYTFQHPDFTINTYRIDLKGDFISILRFINQFERHFENARLIHTQFENSKNAESGKKELITTLLIQNYEQKN